MQNSDSNAAARRNKFRTEHERPGRKEGVQLGGARVSADGPISSLMPLKAATSTQETEAGMSNAGAEILCFGVVSKLLMHSGFKLT